MKNISRILTIISFAFIALFASCSNFGSESADNESRLVAVNIKNAASTRTLFPEVTLNSFSHISVTVSQGGTLVSQKTFTPAEFASGSISWIIEVTDAMLSSDFNFEMLAVTSETTIFRGTLTKRLSALAPTELAFTLEEYSVASGNNGTLSIKFSASRLFSKTEAAWLDFDLYTDMAMTQKAKETDSISLGNSKEETVTVNSLATGSYIYSVKVYNLARTKILYRKTEAVHITSGRTTSGEITLPVDGTYATEFHVSSTADLVAAKEIIDTLPEAVTPTIYFVDYEYTEESDDSLLQIKTVIGVNPSDPAASKRKYVLDFTNSPELDNFDMLFSQEQKIYASKLVLPEAVEYIDSNWFQDIDTLYGIVIPKSVDMIVENAFSGCTGLTANTLVFEDKESWNKYTDVDFKNYEGIEPDVLSQTVLENTTHFFDKVFQQITPEKFNEGIISTYLAARPNVHATLQFEEFDNTNIATVNQELVNAFKIEGSANPKFILDYSKCTAITTFNFAIDQDGESKLIIKKAILPTSVESIAENAFRGIKLQDINLEELENLIIISDYAFNQTLYLEKVKLPARVSTIGKSCFYRASTLKNADLSETKIQTLPESVFSNTALTDVQFPATLTRINNGAFTNCTNIHNINLDYTQWKDGDEEAFTSLDSLISYLRTGTSPITKITQ
ncbi:MAG: leucine-rich repeat domain-containing protein [Treponema sp.]|nr:leucine-rich repeat domain-containing protein [Candidatus Treponema equifaecale]